MRNFFLFFTFFFSVVGFAGDRDFPIRYVDSLVSSGFASPVVEMEIAGRTGLFLVDSGASVTVLAKWFAEEASVKSGVQGKTSDATGDRKATRIARETWTMKSRHGEKVAFGNRFAVIVDLPSVFKEHGLAGILSPQQLLVKEEICLLNLGSSPFLRIQDNWPSDFQGTPLDVVVSAGPGGTETSLYTLKALVEGDPAVFVVDTGADGVGLGSETQVGKKLFSKSKISAAKVGGISGSPQGIREIPSAQVEILGKSQTMKIRLQPVSAEMPASGMIGMQFLKRCALALARNKGSISCPLIL